MSGPESFLRLRPFLLPLFTENPRRGILGNQLAFDARENLIHV